MPIAHWYQYWPKVQTQNTLTEDEFRIFFDIQAPTFEVVVHFHGTQHEVLIDIQLDSVWTI